MSKCSAVAILFVLLLLCLEKFSNPNSVQKFTEMFLTVGKYFPTSNTPARLCVK